MKKLFCTMALAGSCLLPLNDVQATDDYLMRGGDQLFITVYNHPDLSTQQGVNQYIVRPDGKLSMPLIGEIDVNNKSVAQVTHEISERLSEYLVNPQVTINVVELGTTRVYVLGEIQKQGAYELTKSHNLLDAVAAAGGFSEKTSKKNVFVIRRGEQEPFLKANLNDLLKKGDKSQNIALNEGDCVYLTSNGKISFARDIMPFISGVYMATEIHENEKN